MKSLICISALLLFACTSTQPESIQPDETRKAIDSVIRVTPGIDSLSILLDNYKATGNKYGMMRANSQLGKRYRETDRFNEAPGERSLPQALHFSRKLYHHAKGSLPEGAGKAAGFD